MLTIFTYMTCETYQSLMQLVIHAVHSYMLEFFLPYSIFTQKLVVTVFPSAI